MEGVKKEHFGANPTRETRAVLTVLKSKNGSRLSIRTSNVKRTYEGKALRPTSSATYEIEFYDGKSGQSYYGISPGTAEVGSIRRVSFMVNRLAASNCSKSLL